MGPLFLLFIRIMCFVTPLVQAFDPGLALFYDYKRSSKATDSKSITTVKSTLLEKATTFSPQLPKNVSVESTSRYNEASSVAVGDQAQPQLLPPLPVPDSNGYQNHTVFLKHHFKPTQNESHGSTENQPMGSNNLTKQFIKLKDDINNIISDDGTPKVDRFMNESIIINQEEESESKSYSGSLILWIYIFVFFVCMIFFLAFVSKK